MNLTYRCVLSLCTFGNLHKHKRIDYTTQKYIPFGGPDGGDGGKGGDIFFKVNTNINTLVDFQNKKIFNAKNGQKGAGKNNVSITS